MDFSGNNQSILVTGASGALGRALANHHAAANISMNLWGRDRDKLSRTARDVSLAGVNVISTVQDLQDVGASVEKMLEQDRHAPFDLAYFVAGIGETRASGEKVESADLVLRTAMTNFAAPATMAAALAGRMIERGSGRIILIGSAAAHHSLPFAAAYSGSKAGLARFADALRIAAAPHGVSVTLAAPGFIDTPANNAQTTTLPFKISVEEAARRIAMAGEKRKRHYVTPWQFAALMQLERLLPPALRDRVLLSLDHSN